MDYIIRSLDKDTDIELAAQLLREANAPVAKELKLTVENAPTNPAFMDAVRLQQELIPGKDYFVLEVDDKITGMVAIEKAPTEEDVYYIERLAVLPKFQHQGLGKALMQFAARESKYRGGKVTSVAIINENVKLKTWYSHLGYEETWTKKFEHLPFTVCFMKKELA